MWIFRCVYAEQRHGLGLKRPTRRAAMRLWRIWEAWHWLEYLRIIEDIDIKDFCGGEETINRLNNALSESINRHCEGIKMLNALLAESQK